MCAVEEVQGRLGVRGMTAIVGTVVGVLLYVIGAFLLELWRGRP